MSGQVVAGSGLALLHFSPLESRSWASPRRRWRLPPIVPTRRLFSPVAPMSRPVWAGSAMPLSTSLRKQAVGMNITSYGVNYKASKLQLHGGDGAKDAISHIKSTLSSCPDTKIVLGGYSQGASVINIVAGNPLGGITWGDSLPPQYADNVAAITTFGDVGTRTKQSISTQSALYGSKAVDLCNPMDPICHEGQGNEWSGHTEGYVPVYTTQAAAFAASKLLAGSGEAVPGYGPALPDYGYGPTVLGYGPTSPGYGPTPPGYGPTPGYDPNTSLHGPQPGDSPETPGYGQQPPGSGPATPGPTSSPSEIGWV